jgi:hypothetical protein
MSAESKHRNYFQLLWRSRNHFYISLPCSLLSNCYTKRSVKVVLWLLLTPVTAVTASKTFPKIRYHNILFNWKQRCPEMVSQCYDHPTTFHAARVKLVPVTMAMVVITAANDVRINRSAIPTRRIHEAVKYTQINN